MSKIVTRRHFQLTALDQNNNKFWNVTEDDQGVITAHWGRVGAKGQTRSWSYGKDLWEMIRSKERKGYKEIELHHESDASPAQIAPSPVVDPDIADIVQFILSESNTSVRSYSSVPVDKLSADQIAEGRKIYDRIAQSFLSGGVSAVRVYDIEDFMNTIPTAAQLNLRDHAATVRFFTNDLHDHEENLDNLAAAITQVNVATGAQAPISPLGNVELKRVLQGTPLWDYLSAIVYSKGLSPDRYQDQYKPREAVHSIYEVMIPDERARFEADTVRTKGTNLLFHGTRARNLLSIFKQGLIVPTYAANGWRFGAGIYFADLVRRSLNYSSSTSWRRKKTILIAECAQGDVAQLRGDDSRLRNAPPGFDSVQGLNAYSGMDEFILYRAAQQTLRAIVVME